MIYSLFIRNDYDAEKYDEIFKIWSKTLNINNFHYWNKNKVINLFSKEYEKEFLVFRFNLLREWINLNKDESVVYLNTLLKIINILCLKNYLNAKEKNYIFDLKTKNFTNSRNLKSLIIDFEQSKNEITYFHYRKVSVLFNGKIIEMADLYLTTKRIVITYLNEIISFLIDKILNLTFFNEYFQFEYYGKLYKFYYSDINVLELSFHRLFDVIKAEFKNE
ncbi:MAG: hypothetical protein ACRC4L_01745 [Mycoplasma sp.]